MNVKELIEHLNTLDRNLPVWFTISDDCERCYQKLEKEHITVEEVCRWEEADEQEHFPAVVIANGVFFS